MTRGLITLYKPVYDAIEAGAYPKWKFGVQIVEEEKEHDFDFGMQIWDFTDRMTDRHLRPLG